MSTQVASFAVSNVSFSRCVYQSMKSNRLHPKSQEEDDSLDGCLTRTEADGHPIIENYVLPELATEAGRPDIINVIIRPTSSVFLRHAHPFRASFHWHFGDGSPSRRSWNLEVSKLKKKRPPISCRQDFAGNRPVRTANPLYTDVYSLGPGARVSRPSGSPLAHHSLQL
jgi:hypothetical protein